MQISDDRILRILDLAAARMEHEGDSVTSPAVFHALRRAHEAVQVSEDRALAAERRCQELVSQTVRLLTTVRARIEEAEARAHAAEEQIAEERKRVAELREQLAGERRIVEALERHAANLIEAAETRARDAEERLSRICTVLRDTLKGEEARRSEIHDPSVPLH